MSIMEMFRNITGSSQATPAPPQGAGTPPNPNLLPGPQGSSAVDPSAGNSTAPGASSTAGNTTGTGAAAFPAVEPTGDKSPLDGYLKLWEIDPNAKPPASLVPSITVDPKKIMEGARGVDFTKSLSAATLEGISKGDTKAFLAGINEVGQGALAHASVMASNLVTAALTAQEKAFREEVMPDMLRKHNVSNALRTDNPMFDNPAVKPVLSMIENQFQIKNPNASASEITTLAKQYLSGFATEILTGAGKIVSDPPQVRKTSRGETDWGKFFEVE